jgi:hypothetical protein
MTFLEPVSSVNDEGISNIPAPAQHQHRFFDNGIILDVNPSTPNKFPDFPLRVFKAGNMCVLDGILDLAFTPSAVYTVATIPNKEYRPGGPPGFDELHINSFIWRTA